jgi:tungstate transport system substrate-binding protein
VVTRFAALLLGLAIVAGAAELGAGPRFITLASTTSTENSGLLGHLLPRFLAATGIEVRVVAVGTGQALRIARNGDADVLLVHHRPSEDAFVAEGHGVARHEVMMNDYVIAGPRADPAGIADTDSAIAALTRIAAAGAPFVSRGDDSGTHKREMALWTAAGFDPTSASGAWYREVGAGMGATLNIAAAMPAYLLSDRGTWISFRNKGELTLLVEGDPPLFNPYGVILVNKERHPHVKAAEGQAFIDWLLSDEGQSAIASFRVDGQQLFFPRAGNTAP